MELRPSYPVRTARLALRPLVRADVEDLVAYRSLEEVCSYVPFSPMDVDEISRRVARDWKARTRIVAEGDVLGIGAELTGTVIGDLVLSLTSTEHRCGEVGWVFHPAHSGHGYATEAAHALAHLAFDQLGLHRIVARVDARNTASERLAERLGMRREAHLVENEWFKGAWSDELVYALLEQEWSAQHATGSRSCRWPLAP